MDLRFTMRTTLIMKRSYHGDRARSREVAGVPASRRCIRDNVSAFYISGEPVLIANMSRVMACVTSLGRPTVVPYPDGGRAGLLMSNATDPEEGYRQAGA